MNKVELIPWDPDCDQHVKRLYDQRVACGWHQTAIPGWKEAQLGGSKVMYWIVGLPILTDIHLGN